MILVTGGTGIVGAHILNQLTASGQNVVALKREQSDIDLIKRIFEHYNNRNFHLVDWINCDITDITDLNEVITTDVEHIYHAAAVVSFERKHKKQLFETNITATKNIVNLALDKGVKKLGFISSVATLGKEISSTIYSEDNKWNPDYNNSLYAISKFEAEQEVWRGTEEGLEAVIINPGVIIGPGHLEKSSAAIFGKIKKGLKFYTKGVNGFVDARDVADSVIQLVNSNISKERFVCVGANLPFNELFTKVAHSLSVKAPSIYASPFTTSIAWRIAKVGAGITGKMPVITKDTAVTSHMTRVYDSTKLTKAISFQFRTMDEACQNTGTFFKNNG